MLKSAKIFLNLGPKGHRVNIEQCKTWLRQVWKLELYKIISFSKKSIKIKVNNNEATAQSLASKYVKKKEKSIRDL